MKPIFSTRIDYHNPVHTRVTVFNRGGNAGMLCVNTDDAAELIQRLEGLGQDDLFPSPEEVEPIQVLPKKLVMLLIVQSLAIPRDIGRGRGIAWQVLAEVAMIPNDAIPDSTAEIANMAKQYVDYDYGDGPEPEWWRHDEWVPRDW